VQQVPAQQTAPPPAKSKDDLKKEAIQGVLKGLLGGQ
jgi:hypothetical protein